MTMGYAEYLFNDPNASYPGMGHWDGHLDRYSRGLLGNITVGQQDLASNRDWRLVAGLYGEEQKLWENAAGDRVAWNTSRKVATPGTWYRMEFLPWDCKNKFVALDLASMGKGSAWLNGHHLGRYFIANSSADAACNVCNATGRFDPNKECATNCGNIVQRYYHVPPDWWLPPSSDSGELNIVVLWEEVGGDPDAVRIVELQHTGGHREAFTAIADGLYSLYI
jgi:hypothetical protein